MSMWGRALAGAGSGASEIANKYIDQEIMLARAQAMADIQRVSAIQTEREMGPMRTANQVAAETALGPVRTANEVARFQATDAAERNPQRLAELRAAKDADLRAGHTTTTDLALEDARNVPLTEAQIARTNTVAKGTMGVAAEAAGLNARAIQGAKPLELQPGGEAYDSSGKLIARNAGMTSAEASLMAYREGFKGQHGEDKERSFVAAAAQIRDALKEKNAAIDKMRAENPQALTPGTAAEKGLIFDKKAVPNPAYDALQTMIRERAVLQKQQADLQNEWKANKADPGSSSSSSSSGRADPLSMRASGSKFGNLPGETDKAQIYAKEYVQEAAKAAAATDPEERARSERYLAELAGEMRKAGLPIPSVSGSKPVAQAPAAPPAAAPQMPPSPPAPLAARAAAAADVPPATTRIPDPPAETRPDPRTGRPVANPAYLVWQRTWGQEYEERQRALNSGPKMTAATGYGTNPYAIRRQ